MLLTLRDMAYCRRGSRFKTLFKKMTLPKNIEAEDLRDGQMWFTRPPAKNLRLTIFVVTIGGRQISSAIGAIHNLIEAEPILFHVIKNVTPASKAYDEMRRRCTTPYFVQLDEDMELYPEAILIFAESMNTWPEDRFVTYYPLADNVLGIGNPPIVQSLKLYCARLMRPFPCHADNVPIRSSVDGPWHKQLEAAGYRARASKKVIGNHGRTRSLFDLFLRYCKTTASLLDPTVKTHSGHLCILLRALGPDKASRSLAIVTPHFRQFAEIKNTHEEKLLLILNGWVPAARLSDYGLPQARPPIVPSIFRGDSQWAYEELHQCTRHDIHSIICAVAMLCAATGSYAFGADRYPREIYHYFTDTLKYREDERLETLR